MYVGSLNEGARLSFYRAGTTIPLEPEIIGGRMVWRWSTVMASEIDIKYTFDKYCYIGAVLPGIGSNDDGEGSYPRRRSISALTLYVDGVKIAANVDDDIITVNQSGYELTIRARASLSDVIFDGAEIYGFYPDDDEPLLLPRPHRVSTQASYVDIGEITAEGDDAAFAAEFLRDSLTERYAYAPSDDGVAISFEICPEYESERYTVDATDSGVRVRAASRLALLWGACRIIDLWEDGSLPIMSIDDKPDVPMRGFHMGLPRADRIDFAKRLFRYVLLPLGYNHVIVEFNGAMRFDRHPEISEKWLEADRNFRAGKQPKIQHSEMGADGTLLEKDQVRDLLSVLHDYGIEVIPEVQSLGHVQYLTYAHPEITELETEKKEAVDERAADALPDEFYGHTYCPSREDSMRYIYDIIDEIVEVAKPSRYVHIGHDEVYQIGRCPICKKKGKARIYTDHIMALYEHMKKKGLGIMIWSDMLHDNVLDYSKETAVAKNELPRDIVMLDFTWYFRTDLDLEDDILPFGYKVMMGNLYSSHYPRFAKRIAKDGMIGAEISTWVAVSENDYAENGKFFDLVYTSEMLWNAYSYDERNRAAYSALIGQCILPEMRDLIRGRYDLYLATDLEEADVVGMFPGDSTRVPEELSYLYVTEPTAKIEVGAKYDRLIFEHATLNPMPRVAWKPLATVGCYSVTYEDGERIDIPVRYAGDILVWNSHYGAPMCQPYYRHQGYMGTWLADPTYEYRTAEGEPILFLGQVWDNPRPEKTIADISYTRDKDDYAGLISAGVLGIRIK